MVDFRGRLIGINKGHITGWISSSACRTFPFEIAIEIDGVELTRVLPIEVNARVAITGESLENSPLTIEWPVSDSALYQASQAIIADKNPFITIVIPVHNAPHDLERCLDSVIAQTTRNAHLLIIDDASTDPAVKKLLDRIDHKNVTIARNRENIGFAATANRGFALAAPADVVLLNSDTIVPPRWLENLRFAVYNHPAIGTATAMSNNAGAFSAPEPNVDNPCPSSLTAEELGRLISQTSLGLLPETPTANGFCMYIKRACLDDVGVFDAHTFSSGYGEENDFSMRALRAGWRHVVDDRTLVLHARSASFGLKRYSRTRAAAVELARRYPEYPLLVASFFQDSRMMLSRYRVRRAFGIAQKLRPRMRLLTVISTTTGGTPQTNADLIRALVDGYDVFVLASDRQRLSLLGLTNGNFTVVAEAMLSAPLSLSKHMSSEYDVLIASWLVRFAIEIVHIRHIAWHGLGLTWVCRQLDIPVILSFHDFYLVCPTVKLLDEKLNFCGGTCTPSGGPCTAELWPAHEVPPLKHKWVHTWRQQVAAMMEPVDAFVTTSDSTRGTILSNFPSLADRHFAIIPHGRDFVKFGCAGTRPKPRAPIRVLASGNLTISKGALVLAEIAELDRERRLEIHTMGDVDPVLHRDDLIHHGPYERDRCVELVERIRPTFGLILSLWPETYCHTLTELWAAGVPVVAFDIGTVADRIRVSGGGLLVRNRTAIAVYSAILDATSDAQIYNALEDNVRNWQRHEGSTNSTSAMAAAYSELYSIVLDKHRPFSRSTV
jgi:GT2 family glycosyltransferase